MREFILVLCWLGVVQSVLLGTYFTSNSKKRIHNLFLGLMLLMIGVRVAKSTIYMFDRDPELMIMNIGFAAHAMLGPLFLFYIQTLFSRGTAPRFYVLHFVPAFAIAALSSYLELNAFWYRGGYSVLLYYTLGYLVAGWYHFVKNYDRDSGGRVILFLLITLTLFQVSYFSNYILRLTPYETGAIIHSMLIYVITFLVLKDNHIFNPDKKKKYHNLNLSKEEIGRLTKKIVQVMEDKKPYLESDFSLSKFSELTNTPSHILSFVLSEGLKQNFLSFTNSYRITEAKALLTDPTKLHLSIAAIAHDCGFNTLSSFNTAFKKFNGLTPSDYRKKRTGEKVSH